MFEPSVTLESSVQTKLVEGFIEKRSRANVVAIIPAYNEGYTIASVIIDALRYVDKVIVCDDGSVDLTGEIAEKMGATVVRHKTNQGKGAAYKTCLRKAVQDEPDIVVCLDGDGQHEPDKIPGLIRPILYDEADLVIGTRFDKDAKCEAPFYRRIGLKLIDIYSKRAMGCDVTDSQSGFRAFSSRMFEVMLNIESNGYGLETEQIRVTTDNKFRIKEVPVDIKYKDVPKPSKNNPIAHGVEIIGTITQLVVEKRPFLFLGVPGMALFTLGTYTSYLMLQYYNLNRYFSLPLAIISLGSFILGTIFILGFLIFYSFNRMKNLHSQ